MYAYIKGILVQALPASVIVEAKGIGYKIAIPASVFPKLPQIASDITLQTSFVIRENSQALYGFLSEQERDLFEALLGVSGIGPKTALSLIGHLTPNDLQHAVSNNDIQSITKVPGIGKKTAERLIIEMRDKLSSSFALSSSDMASQFHADPRAQKISDAMNALINLGYNQNSAQKALKKTLKDLPEDVQLAELITVALKNV